MTDAATIAAIATGAATAFGAIAAAWARARATARLAQRDVMTTLQEIADRQAEQARASDEQHRECRREVEGLRVQLREQAVRIATAEGHYLALKAEHALCPRPERIAELERELRRQRRLVDGVVRRTTPPGGIASSLSHPEET